MRVLGKILAALGAALIFGGPAVAQASWAQQELAHPIRMPAGKAACANSGDYQLCLSFTHDAVWFAISAQGLDSLGSTFPTFRVDGHPAVDFVPKVIRDIEVRIGDIIVPRHASERRMEWKGLVPSETGEWRATLPPLLAQMRDGNSLTVRIWLSSGEKVDAKFPLDGFCAVAREVFPVAAPPLKCG